MIENIPAPLFIFGAVLGVGAAIVILLFLEVVLFRPAGEQGEPQYQEQRRGHSNGCMIFYVITIGIAAVVALGTLGG